MFGLRHERSTLPVQASNHNTAPANDGVTANAHTSRSSAPGRKSTPRFVPGLRRIRSCTSSSGSFAARTGSTSTVTNSGVGNPSAWASLLQMISAMSALRPWPAPVNFTTYVPRSSASISPGREPPSRNGAT